MRHGLRIRQVLPEGGEGTNSQLVGVESCCEEPVSQRTRFHRTPRVARREDDEGGLCVEPDFPAATWIDFQAMGFAVPETLDEHSAHVRVGEGDLEC